MCVQCVMGAAAGFGVFQTYRYVIKDHARKLLASQRKPENAELPVTERADRAERVPESSRVERLPATS